MRCSRRDCRFNSWDNSTGRFAIVLVDAPSNSCAITSNYLLEILLCDSSTIERWTSICRWFSVRTRSSYDKKIPFQVISDTILLLPYFNQLCRYWVRKMSIEDYLGKDYLEWRIAKLWSANLSLLSVDCLEIKISRTQCSVQRKFNFDWWEESDRNTLRWELEFVHSIIDGIIRLSGRIIKSRSSYLYVSRSITFEFDDDNRSMSSQSIDCFHPRFKSSLWLYRANSFQTSRRFETIMIDLFIMRCLASFTEWNLAKSSTEIDRTISKVETFLRSIVNVTIF